MIWGDHSISQENSLSLEVGTLCCHIQRVGQVLEFIHHHKPDSGATDAETPSVSQLGQRCGEIKRVCICSSDTVRVEPRVPDRPLVVRPESPILLPGQQTTQLYIGMPSFLRIQLKTGNSLTEWATLPTCQLGNTWFGTYAEGLLCYALPLPAQPDLQDISSSPGQVLVEIVVKNNQKDSLYFEKLCLRPKHLALFKDGESMRSSRVVIHYEGRKTLSGVNYDRSPGPEHAHLKLLAEPEEHAKSMLARWTFGTFQGQDFVWGA